MLNRVPVRQNALLLLLAAAVLLGFNASKANAANYAIDSSHASAVFCVNHKGFSYTYGMFTKMIGSVEFDEAKPAESKFELTIDAQSITTGNEARDKHLRGADFFNVKQFRTLKFVSSSVKPAGDDQMEVTGNLTILGKSKPITFQLTKIGVSEEVIGFATELSIKRSEFGMTYGVGPIGDDVKIMISFEANPK